MSALLAVGSPALATFSLVITMFNRGRVAKDYERLGQLSQGPVITKIYHKLITRLNDACYILQESQQTAMRAWEGNGWLSSLILLEGNQDWWDHLKRNLSNTRRGVTISLIAQILFAAIAWFFTVVAAFDNLGDTTVALSISSSSIWLWMIPVIIGWVAVGTQFRGHTIQDALLDPSARCLRAQNAVQYPQTHPPPPVAGFQDGIRTASGILVTRSRAMTVQEPTEEYPKVPDTTPHPADFKLQVTSPTSNASSQREPTAIPTILQASDSTTTDSTPEFASASGDPREDQVGDEEGESLTLLHSESAVVESDRLWGASFTGHEAKEGPIYNYARVFTFLQFSQTVISGFERALKNIQDGRSPRGPWRRHDQHGRVDIHHNLAGSRAQISAFSGYCGGTQSYIAWSQVPGRIWRDMLVAASAAVFVQWSTTGASILVEILTPVNGLGCRSGTYLIYGCLATLSWLLLLTASLISHELMLRKQAALDRRENYRPGKVLPKLFVVCESSGSFIAGCNAIWLLLSSVFELCGVFDNCWCESNYFSLRQEGWVLLFKGASQLAPDAQRVWVGGIAFVAVSCALACTFIWLGCK